MAAEGPSAEKEIKYMKHGSYSTNAGEQITLAPKKNVAFAKKMDEAVAEEKVASRANF